MHRSQDAVRADELGPLRGIVLGDEPLGRDLREMRVGVVTRAVFVGEALRFHLQVQRQR